MNIVELTPSEITRLMERLSDADLHERRVRVAIEGDGFKYKIGEGMWSPPLGHVDPDSDAARARRLDDFARKRFESDAADPWYPNGEV